MTRTQTMLPIVLGMILSITHIIGIPLAWKEWASVLIGVYFIGWGLYLRYALYAPGKTADDIRQI